MSIQNVAVIGSGTMGNGITHVFALYDYTVQLVDISDNIIQKSINIISKNLDRQIGKNIIDETKKKSALNNIKAVVGIEKINYDTDLIVEAVSENKELKLSIFNKLDDIIKPESIFATNTSSISITELAVKRPEKFIGMHFMNPVPVMKLVEVIKGYSTSLETFDKIVRLVKNLDKVPVLVNDFPGFVSNRVLIPMINEAIFALHEGVADKEAIDTVMKLGMNHPMGPLQLADFIGLDICLDIMNVIYTGYNDSKYRPCPLLKKMVAANKLGRKTGEGFYKY